MRSTILLAAASLFALLGLVATIAGAQQRAPSTDGDEGGRARPAAAPPAAEAEGRSQVRAVRLDRALVLDGLLDEEIYSAVPPASGFLQQQPAWGEPATERTDVWVFYDDDQIYIAVRAWDGSPERIVANEMRRDNRNIWLNDNFIVTLDTFQDRRTAFFFQTNPLGGIRDGRVVGEGNTNFDWNAVWDVKTARDDQGWTAEMAIPFKSLRYPPGDVQEWGFNLMRMVRWKNEMSLLSIPPSTYASNGVMRLASAASLVGIEAPAASRNLELRPYAISTLTTDRPAGISNDLAADFGIDARYGITSSVTLDLTYNTDFAQVEIDEQQVNLTRFSLVFPEKRDFFLEGQAVFDFGESRRGGSAAQASQALVSPVPQLFFSRRIGLDAGSPVRIQGGGRLMGRVGPLSMGALNIQTDALPSAGVPSTNFTVVRVKGDVLRSSNVGMLITNRSPGAGGGEGNLVAGTDVNLTFFDNVLANGFYARSSPADSLPGSDPSSYRLNLEYDADRYGLQAERLAVGDAFDPQVGFVRRSDVVRTFGKARFSPRPRASPYVRLLAWEATADRFVNGAGVVETRQETGSFRTELHSGDLVSLDAARVYEFLSFPFRVATDLLVPAGEYRFNDVQVGVMLASHRRISGNLTASRGGFFGGDRTGVGFSGRVEITPRFAVEPRVSSNWISLPQGSDRVILLGGRPTFTVSPRMYVSALTQYNSGTGAIESNLRWRWEFQPGSDLFVVYTDGRGGTGWGGGDLVNRGLAVKVTRFLRF